MDGKKVVVLGGGIGGLTAAHELAERGFSVEIFDLRNIPGGKSRTLPASAGRRPLPGEHGFRFFPAFYQHLPDSMKRIPLDGRRSCFDNLVSATQLELALFETAPLRLPTEFPRSWQDIRLLAENWGNKATNFAPGELQFFAKRMWQVVTSCSERRKTELERQSWWEYIGAETRSENYKRLLANGLSRSLVAAQPRIASARTIGQIQAHLLSGTLLPNMTTDRVLNGPTSDVFINPWIRHLERHGARYHTESEVTKIHLDQGRVSSITVRDGGHPKGKTVPGDWFVAALPVERMAMLLDKDLLDSAPELTHVRALATNVRWMNGIQFFLKEEVPIVRGHVLHLDSPWAITSISEAQFWDSPVQSYGEGNVRSVLSVDISNWDTPGTFVGKKAMDLDCDAIASEVWSELKANFNVNGAVILRDSMLDSFFLDTDIVAPNPHHHVNLEPLFINTPGSWHRRPQATTSIPNFFLAADYIQTNTDLACMEAANEAARRAVNALLPRAGVGARECRLWPIGMPAPLAPLRWIDRQRFERGQPWDGGLPLPGRGLMREISTARVQPRLPLATTETRAERPSGGNATAPDRKITPADNGFHFRQYASRLTSPSYVEWWYFNFVDHRSGNAGMLTFAIANPGNVGRLETASFNAVIFRPDGSVFTTMDYWPGTQFSASAEKSDVVIGPSRLVSVDAATSRITAVTKDDRLAWDLTYRAADKPRLLEDRIQGYAPWEVSSWLAYMPAARVTGSFVLDGQKCELTDASGYHDHDWGIWALPLRTWSWAAFSVPDKEIALDIGFHAAFQHSIAYFRFGEERVTFTKFKVRQSRWNSWRLLWNYPTRMTFTATDASAKHKLEFAWEVVATAPLWKYPLLVFEQSARFTGVYHRRNSGRWRKIADIAETGFSEYATTWLRRPTLSLAGRQ